MKIAVSQPMFIPWIGLFEQISLVDIFVHYDDVQFPQGRSFMNRVQLRDEDGQRWLTANVDRKGSSQIIKDILYLGDPPWKVNHLKLLQQLYGRRPYFDSMMLLAQQIYANRSLLLADFNIFAIEFIASKLNLTTKFVRSSELATEGRASEKLLNICKAMNASVYLTGHGARNYLSHESFESQHIQVEYIDYALTAYDQGFEDFIPYVSILDVLANVGNDFISLFQSKPIPWREFIYGPD